MTPRGHISRERLYRKLTIFLAVVTATLLVPPDWIGLAREPERPQEVEARPVEIVRLPPETLTPPPPLPLRPERRIEPPPEPEPEPQEIQEFRPQLEVPEINIPQPVQRVEKRERLETERLQPVFRADAPAPDVPDAVRPRAAAVTPMPLIAEQARERLEVRENDPRVEVPRNVPRREASQRIELAASTSETYVDLEAPDVDVSTPRPATRAAAKPALNLVSRQLKTGAALRTDQAAPDIDVPSGNTQRPAQSAPVAVSGPVTGTRVVYDSDPGSAREVAIAANRSSASPGAAPKIAANGGTAGVDYSSAPADAPVGRAGSRTVGTGAGKLDDVRARLARKYGLPLVSVNDLGQRSTEAARWNLLLPQISDLLKQARDLGGWRGAGTDPVSSIERDGSAVVIRYRDGVVHVIVPTREGLAALFVARGDGSRPVVSKVEEAEAARKALYRYTRGAS